MAKKVWTLELEDGRHTVELEHGYFSGERTIRVDGQLRVQAKKLWDTGSEHSLQIGEHPCAVRIRNQGLTFGYELVADGRVVQSPPVVEKSIQVCFPDGEVREYPDYDRLRQEILRGDVKKDHRARVLSGSSEGPQSDIGKEWSTLERVAGADSRLRFLYRPVWAHTVQGLSYGAIAGVALKALDTTWLLFTTNPLMGLEWLLVVAALLVRRWWLYVFVIIIMVRLGLGVNLFFTALSVTLVGVAFGGPAGMAVGTLVGHLRRRRLPRAPDADEEGARPYVIGLLAPIVFLVLFLSFYLLWLMPTLADWLER